MKATQSRMGEAIRMIQEALGQVSCCLWEGIGPSLPPCLSRRCPTTPALCPWVSPTVKVTGREEWEGCPVREAWKLSLAH